MRGSPPRWVGLFFIISVPIGAVVLAWMWASGRTDWPPSHPLAIAGAVIIGLSFLYLVAQEFGRKTFRIAMVLMLLLALADLAATGASAPATASAPEKIVGAVTASTTDEIEREETDPDGETKATITESTTRTTIDSTTIEPINPPEDSDVVNRYCHPCVSYCNQVKRS